MTRTNESQKKQPRSLTAPELGRYLKRLATIQRDQQTGNRQLSEALLEVSSFLISSNAKTVSQAVISLQKSEAILPDAPKILDENASLDEISSLLARKEVTRSDLVKLGGKRFGIPESKLKSLSRDAIIKSVRSALEHEQSIEILSDEAKKGGQSRNS